MRKIIKRAMSVLLAMVMVFGAAPLGGLAGLDLFSTQASAADTSGTCGQNLSWSFNETTGVLSITGTGAMTDWENYSSVTWYYSIPWYYSRSLIKTVSIASGVTSIGDGAFYDCSGLTIVTIPASVTSIGIDAFYDTGYYNTASNWKNGVLYIGTNLIDAKSSELAADCTIASGTTLIADSAFGWCESLTSITIPSGVTRIGDSAFYGCSSLTSIIIPSSVTSIGNFAFYGCTSLTNIAVETANTKYSSSEGVLFNKDKTTLIQYPAGNTRTSYTIPSSVTSIGNSAFRGCSSLTSIIIPSSVTSIGNFAFSGCSSLISVSIPASVTSTGYAAFRGCDSLSDVYYGGSESDRAKMSIADDNNPLINATWYYNYISVQIKNNPGTKTINYGEGVAFTAVVTDLPEGAQVTWFVNGVAKGTGENYTFSNATADATVTVKIVGADGEVILDADDNEISDTETIKVKAGFWQKFVSFLKNLFNVGRIVAQAMLEK